MITCHTITRIEQLDFQKYIELPGYSHSFLKSEKHGFSQSKSATIKMQLGSLVDGIRTNGDVDMYSPLYPEAKKIAAHLKAEFGWVLDSLHAQVSYTGIMQYDAGRAIFQMPVKGRPDWEWPAEFIIDLKVTSEPVEKIESLIKFMGYPNQQFGYAKQSQAKKSFLLFYSTKSKKTLLKPVHIGDSNKFWEEKILKFGKVI